MLPPRNTAWDIWASAGYDRSEKSAHKNRGRNWQQIPGGSGFFHTPDEEPRSIRDDAMETWRSEDSKIEDPKIRRSEDPEIRRSKIQQSKKRKERGRRSTQGDAKGDLQLQKPTSVVHNFSSMCIEPCCGRSGQAVGATYRLAYSTT